MATMRLSAQAPLFQVAHRYVILPFGMNGYGYSASVVSPTAIVAW